MVPLKYLRDFSRALEMLLINCEMSLLLTCEECVLVASTPANQLSTFTITDTKLYVSVVTLSTQDNVSCLNN